MFFFPASGSYAICSHEYELNTIPHAIFYLKKSMLLLLGRPHIIQSTESTGGNISLMSNWRISARPLYRGEGVERSWGSLHCGRNNRRADFPLYPLLCSLKCNCSSFSCEHKLWFTSYIMGGRPDRLGRATWDPPVVSFRKSQPLVPMELI